MTEPVLGPAAAAPAKVPVLAPATIAVEHLSTVVEATAKGVLNSERTAIRSELSMHPMLTLLLGLIAGAVLGVMAGIPIGRFIG